MLILENGYSYLNTIGSFFPSCFTNQTICSLFRIRDLSQMLILYSSDTYNKFNDVHTTVTLHAKTTNFIREVTITQDYA